MNTYEVICTRRSIREFRDKKIPYPFLEKFVNAGRLAPQAANRQPLEFIVADADELTDKLFDLTKLAGYLEWKPSKEKKARGFIAIVVNQEIQKTTWVDYDVALAAENICLAAWAEGIGSCLIGAFNKEKVTTLLQVPETHELKLLVALGYPAHESQTEEMEDNKIEYSRDENGKFHVPKRPLKKILHHNKF